MATMHEGNKLFDAQSVKGNVDNNNNVIRDTVNTGSQSSGNNILRSGVEGDDIVLNNTTIEQNGLLGNDNESYRIVVIGSQDIRYPVSDSGYIEDGTGENPLRPVVYDGDILYIYTIRGAVTSLIINTDNTYNKEIYPILYKLDESSILPHVSVTDLNVASGYRMVAINAVRNNDSISLWYYQTNGINGNCDIYKVTIYPDGTCEREHGNIDDGFYRVGEDGYFWKWDNDLKQYVSIGKHTSIQYARELLDADDLFFKDSNDQGEEITIEDPGTTGTVLWGAESANKVSLSVNGVSKLLLKSQALDGINSSISTILGYFSSGSARNALLLEGHSADYFATGSGLADIDIRVTALESASFDPTEMWELLSAATSEQINISHIPDITTSKILNLESWITGKGYITNSADNLINYYLKNDVYNKQEVAELIGSINQFHFEIYPELPVTGQSNVLYLIGPKGDTDVYDEYVYSNNTWTRIGSTSIDLSGYVQNTRTINTGSGLVGGGDLSVNRTISLSPETLASLALADTALQPSDIDGYVNDIATGQGNYISGVSKNGKVLTFTYGTLPTTIALSNVTGAEDLRVIEALSGTGFLKRIGDNSWTLDANTYALSGDLLAVSGRVTTLESRINWDNYFGIDSQGNIYVRDIDENTPRAFYNNGSITAGGINSSGGGGGGTDLERVWESLINNTDYPNVEINIAHIPTIPYSHISGTPVIPTIIDRARDLLDGDDLSYVNPDEGEEITITDDGRTGTVLWGAESANQVALSVNGTSKTLLKIAALNGINSSITTLLGYFSSGSARNSLMLGGNSPDYYATSSGLNSIDTRVSALENAAFDSDTMWDLLGESTDEQINLSHIPDLTTEKISDIESWIARKGYIVLSDIPTEISAFNNDVGYLTQHQSLANYYTKGEVDNEIGALRSISITGTGYLTGGGTLAQNRTIDISQQVKTKIDNGSTAYSWGDHSAAGYFLSSNFTKSNIKSTLGISDWALSATKPTYSYTEITGLSAKLSDIEGDITSATGRIQSIEDWFTNPSLNSLTVISPINADITGNSATASRLKGNGAYTAWGRTYWSNGVPKSISGAIENATTINASGAITLSGANNTARRIYFGDTDHYLELDEHGFHFSHGIYSEDFVTAKGINSTGGGGNVDLDRVWESLTNNTDFPDEKINISHIPTIPWAQLSDTPITIAGYGITDAKINNGVITIGNNSITPLTSHQSLDAYVNAAGYNSTLKQIELKHGSTVVATVDATAFIKDGMVSNVTISDGYLVISFNTDSGKEDIRIPISDIFDASNYYTKSDADGLFFLIEDFTKDNIKSTLGIYDWALASTKPSYTKAEVGLGDVENIALSTWAGSTNITTLGTITTGTWNGNKITNSYLANNTISVGNATISLGGSASLSQIGVAQWAQTQDSTIDFSALPNLYIGTTRVQDSSATQALTGITTISASGLATVTGGISLGGEYNEEDSKLVWDDEHSAWHLIGNFYADGYITAGGLNSSGGSGSVDLNRVWESLINNTDFPDEKINVAHIPSLSWNIITSDKPDTLSGYGITDASINNGLITLGVDTIRPIVSASKGHAVDGGSVSYNNGEITIQFPTAQTVIEYARDLLDAEDLCFVDPEEGEEITIGDDGRTGTVLWGAESANQVVLSVNGTSKTMLKAAAIDGITSRVGLLEGYFSNGVARNAQQLNGHSESYFATASSVTTEQIAENLTTAGYKLTDTIYSLPTASSDTLGGIKIGSGLSINDGVVSVTGQTQGTVTRIDVGQSVYNPDVNGIVSLPDYATKTYVGQQGFITKAVNDLTNYYLKGETYTKTEVESLIGAINQFRYEIAASISAVDNPQSNVLYLIGPTGTGVDKYEEYVYDSTKTPAWIKIGDTSIDLSGYVTLDTTQTITGDKNFGGYVIFNSGDAVEFYDGASFDDEASFGGEINAYSNVNINDGNLTLSNQSMISLLNGAGVDPILIGWKGNHFDPFEITGRGVDIDGGISAEDTIITAGDVIADGNIVGYSFKKVDGTSSQFLKADGSVDSNTYLTQHQNSWGDIEDEDGQIVAPQAPGSTLIISGNGGTSVNAQNGGIVISSPAVSFGTAGTDYRPLSVGDTTVNYLTGHQSLADYVTNTALSAWVGSQNINTLGTVTTGVWHGTKIANEYLTLDMSWSLVRASATYDTEDYIHVN